jgi:RNA polymerase sigma-70 factor (ECF subfamily)
MTRNAHDAEDIVQEALLKAYRGLNRFEERSQPGTWLHRITSNCAIDHLRKQKRLREDSISDETTGPSPEALVSRPATLREMALRGDVGRGVSAAFGRMSDVERTAFVLRHYEGRTLAEIGESLGLSLAATKQAVFRAVRKARAALEPLVAEATP